MTAQRKMADINSQSLVVGANLALMTVLAERPTLNSDAIWEAVCTFDRVAQRLSDGVEGDLRAMIQAAATDAVAGYLRTSSDALYRAGQAGGAVDAPSWPARKIAQKAARGALTTALTAARAYIGGETPPVLRVGMNDHAQLATAFNALVDVVDHDAVITARAEWWEARGYDPDEPVEEPTPISRKRGGRAGDGGDGGRPGEQADEHRAIWGTSCYLGDGDIYELRNGERRVVLPWRPFVEGTTHVPGDDAGKQNTYLVGLVHDGSDVRPVREDALRDGTCWGQFREAIGHAGRRQRDMLFNVVQTLGKERPWTEAHNAIGCHEVEGHWVYLTGDACIGAAGPVPGIAVQLAGRMANYRLPAPPPLDSPEARAAMRTAVDLFRVAPLPVMAPLIGAAFLAPLGEALGTESPDVTVWLNGNTQTYKTAVNVLAQSFYGPFTEDSLPLSFMGSIAGAEPILHWVKDAYCAVDDYYPTSDPVKQRAMATFAEHVLRSVGNGTDRTMGTRTGTPRAARPPRCVPVVTGEQQPPGGSAGARAFEVPVARGDVDVTLLTVAQDRIAALPVVMACYVRAVTAGMDRPGPDGLQATVLRRFRELRTLAQRDTRQPRGPGQVAHLYLGLEMFLTLAHDAGAIDAAERDALLADAWDALLELAARQAAALAEESPAERYVDLLADEFASRHAYLTDEDGNAPPDPLTWGWEADHMTAGQYRHLPGPCLGFVLGDWVCLYPDASYQQVSAAARRAGETFPHNKRATHKRLAEAGYIQVEAGGRHAAPRVSINGDRLRMLKLSRDAFSPARSVSSKGSMGSMGSTTPILGVDGTPLVDPFPYEEHERGPLKGSTVGVDGSQLDPMDPMDPFEETLRAGEETTHDTCLWCHEPSPGGVCCASCKEKQVLS